MKIFTFLPNISLLLNPAYLFAQNSHGPVHDASYYKTYLKALTTRLYRSEPYTALTLKAFTGQQILHTNPIQHEI